jgi:polyisoprenyl-phosphate glycosyltransferase
MNTSSRFSLTILIPVYNEEKSISGNLQQIRSILQQDGITCRFILVDDGSKDRTWAVIKGLAEQDDSIQSIRLSRNFGKEAALCAGVSVANDDLLLVMDADLQHPPRYIKAMMEKMQETGVDIVHGVKSNRGKESIGYKLIAKSFYRMFNMLTGIDMGNSSDFKLMSRKVVETLKGYSENNVFFRGIVNWSGYEGVTFPFEVDERSGETSRFSVKKLAALASNAVMAYTSKPMYVTVISGLLFFLLSVILGVQTLLNYFSGEAMDGFSTVILLLLITGSVIMLSLGIIGAYVAKIYDEVKKRPQFIISEKAGKNDDK